MFVKYVSLLFRGRDGVVACSNSLVSVGGVCVFVVEASYEPAEFGGICVEGDGVEYLFPFCLLFVTDIIGYFFVKCLDSVDDIRGGEEVSEVVPCPYFVFDVSVEAGAKVFDSPGRNVVSTIACNDVCEVFGGSVNGGEVVCVEVRKVVFYVVCECAPVCSVVISVCALGRGCVGTV